MMKEELQNEINRRAKNGMDVASRFPELKGLSFEDFLEKCPLDLDFITTCEMYESLNS